MLSNSECTEKISVKTCLWERTKPVSSEKGQGSGPKTDPLVVEHHK